MTTTELLSLNTLYEQDETAWLEAMSELAAEGRFAEMDHVNLSEYLADMAKRDRREVSSRLVLLLTHLLKWEHQSDYRTGSWQGTILEQRRELRKLLDSGTLYNHALAVLPEAYADARKQAAAETTLPRATFPADCAWDLESLVADDEVME
ncbi:MAG TPA: DUF29 domain-containing protein [Gemmataceae bacterium]|jgi:hypothetical protein|nr:DUF29 domain-containing protein [Gemmataceae bacterium]